MTNADIFTQILHEVTGQPKAEVSALVDQIKRRFPGQTRFDEEVPPAEAQHLLAALRQEQSGILNWVLAGCQMAMAPKR